MSLWAVIWMTGDGPSVDLHASQEDAWQALAKDYVAFDRVEKIEDALAYYDQSGDEWIIGPLEVPNMTHAIDCDMDDDCTCGVPQTESQIPGGK